MSVNFSSEGIDHKFNVLGINTLFQKNNRPSLKAQFREPVHTSLFGTAPSGGAMFCKKHPIKNAHTKRIN
jgi:hypothetical protein